MTAKLLFPAPVCNPENFSILHKHDILPTKIAGLRSCDVTRDGLDVEAFHLGLLKHAAYEYAKRYKLDLQQHARILDPIFLLEEFHRIIYGWQCNKESVYLEKERVGRGNNLRCCVNSPTRVTRKNSILSS